MARERRRRVSGRRNGVRVALRHQRCPAASVTTSPAATLGLSAELIRWMKEGIGSSRGGRGGSTASAPCSPGRLDERSKPASEGSSGSGSRWSKAPRYVRAWTGASARAGLKGLIRRLEAAEAGSEADMRGENEAAAAAFPDEAAELGDWDCVMRRRTESAVWPSITKWVTDCRVTARAEPNAAETGEWLLVIAPWDAMKAEWDELEGSGGSRDAVPAVGRGSSRRADENNAILAGNRSRAGDASASSAETAGDLHSGSLATLP